MLLRDHDELVLRLSISFLWIVTAVLCVTRAFPQSLVLLSSCGLRGPWARLLLFATCAAAGGLGLLTMVLPRRPLRICLLLQGAAVIFFTLVITVFLREHWLHPLGPITKNIPLLGAIWVLYRHAGDER